MFCSRARTSLVGEASRPRPISLWIEPLAAALIGVAVLAPAGVAEAAQTPVGLGTDAAYSVIGGVSVSNTGASTLSGDLGLSPGNASSITGFPPGIVAGATNAANGPALQAQTDLTTAYNTAAGEGPTTAVAADLAGQTLTPGIYNSASSLGLSGALTLNGAGNPNSLFVFQAGSTLTTGSASSVNLINGAQACNVYWQVGSSATLGTGSTFRGNILAMQSITVTTGVSVIGRALARNGSVTLDTDTFTAPACTTPTGTTTTTPKGTSGTANASAKTASPTGTGTAATGTPGATGTGTPSGTTGTGTLPFTGMNPLLPIVGGSLVGFGLLLMGMSNARRRRSSTVTTT